MKNTSITSLRLWLLASLVCLSFPLLSRGANLSPGSWPREERERLEQMEFQSWTPPKARSLEGGKGMISATVSPIAVRAGEETLRQGGSAADAAATIALTQITTQLGSVVSYAGILSVVYFDAHSGRVHFLDAGYNSYRGETEPLSIPASDLGALAPGRKASPSGAKGRETLVPGFMAGIEELHHRFGRLPFRDLFAPALWYGEHGVRVSPTLFALFSMREKCFQRTPEGRLFLGQSGKASPQIGDNFLQQDLARTLRAVSEQGAGYLYTGPWAKHFVEIVNREGGKATLEDLTGYRPTWLEPRHLEVFGSTVFTSGGPHLGAYGLFSALNLAEVRNSARRGTYWTEADGFQELTRICQMVMTAPALNPAAAAQLDKLGVNHSPEAQLTQAYARALSPVMDELFTTPQDDSPRHSNAIVVVDREGNVAAITHTINAVVWGDTGIVVDGIPLPDSASFQQARLAAIAPGSRVPHEIVDAIVLQGGKPVLAIAGIGSSLLPESIRVLFGVLGQKQNLADLMAAPPLLSQFDANVLALPARLQPVIVPQDAYPTAFLEKVRSKGSTVIEVPRQTADALRGTLAAVAIDPKTSQRRTVETPGVMIFGGAE